MMITCPPHIEELEEPGPLDALRVAWWAERGFWHGAMRGPDFMSRVVSAALAVLWWPSSPMVVVSHLRAMRRTSARYYLAPARDAVIGVVATAEGWSVVDHLSSRPGTGQGQVLRALVAPALITMADAGGVAITATASTARLAEAYEGEFPGLRDVGPRWPRGHRMRREPQT